MFRMADVNANDCCVVAVLVVVVADIELPDDDGERQAR